MLKLPTRVYRTYAGPVVSRATWAAVAELAGSKPHQLAEPQLAPFVVLPLQRDAAEKARLAELPAQARIADSGIAPRALRFDAQPTSEVGRGIARSKQNVSLYLTDVTLNANFNFWKFIKTNKLYLVAVVWDESGKAPRVIPHQATANAPPAEYRIKPCHSIEFVGDGMQLWPSSKIVGALHMQLLVMKRNEGTRDVAQKLAAVIETTAKSGLSKLLQLAGGAAIPGGGEAIAAAAEGLGRSLAFVLKGKKDKVVGTFSGSFGVENIDGPRTQTVDTSGASIGLKLNASR